MTNWKNLFKSWAGVPVLILAALLAVWLVVAVTPRISSAFEAWQAKRAYEKLMEPYYKDTYGGKTPEETYDLFLVALKDGDTELASRYFTIEDQDSWKKTLSEYEKSGFLADFVGELENTKKLWIKSSNSTDVTVSFKYNVEIKEGTKATIDGQEVEIPAGNYQNESMFVKYPTGIWKIEVL